MMARFNIQLMDKMRTEETFKSKPDFVDLVNLVRSIQRAEGNIDCYRSGWQQCDRINCAWRDHCLNEPGKASMAARQSHQHNKAADPKQEQDSLHSKPALKGFR
jgi:hypothetical protein